MQGPERSSSIGMRNGVEMAVAEAGGGVNDNASPQTGTWDHALEAANATRAVADPQAIVYFGPNQSGAAASSIPITNRAHMAQISPGATYPGLTKRIVGTSAPGEPWRYRPLALVNFFRPLSTDDVQGGAAANWAKRLGVKSVFILNDDGAYGRGVANVFEATAKKIGRHSYRGQRDHPRDAGRRSRRAARASWVPTACSSMSC
jgi:branched-chain amino acid transport system substrate-binding protein